MDDPYLHAVQGNHGREVRPLRDGSDSAEGQLIRPGGDRHGVRLPFLRPSLPARRRRRNRRHVRAVLRCRFAEGARAEDEESTSLIGSKNQSQEERMLISKNNRGEVPGWRETYISEHEMVEVAV